MYIEKTGNRPLTEGEESPDTLNDRIEKYRSSFFWKFFIVGTINNNGYTMVHAGSSSIAASFGKKSFTGYFLFFMRGAGVISRYVNGAYCVNIPHMTRIKVITILSVISFLGIALASSDTTITWYF